MSKRLVQMRPIVSHKAVTIDNKYAEAKRVFLAFGLLNIFYDDDIIKFYIHYIVNRA
jgi:hypothetical protein